MRRAIAGWRTRIVVWFTVAVVVLGAGLFAAMLLQLNRQLDDRVDDRLSQEVEELRELASATDPLTGGPVADDLAGLFELYLRRNVPDQDEYQFTVLDGRPFLRSSEEPRHRLDLDDELWRPWVGAERVFRDDVDTPGGHVEYLAVPVTFAEETGVFVTSIFDDVERDLLTDAVTTTARTVGLGGLAVAVLLAWWLSTRLTRPVGVMAATARDVSDRRLDERIEVRGHGELADLARTINSMLDRLEAAFDTQRSFLADVGHELRTPITVVRGHVELIDVGDPEDREATVALVTDELDRMDRLVGDLLTLARSESPDFVEPGEMDLDEIPSAVVERMRAVAPRREWHTAEPEPVRVIADRARLVQALVALADNAVVHTPPATPVEVGADAVSDEIIVWVSDRGPGIPEADRERLQERFVRGEVSGDRVGSGLGLAIAGAIARAHGGRLVIADVDGGGARIELRLPFRRAETGEDDTWTAS